VARRSSIFSQRICEFDFETRFVLDCATVFEAVELADTDWDKDDSLNGATRNGGWSIRIVDPPFAVRGDIDIDIG
jgi:hypothetical protein